MPRILGENLAEHREKIRRSVFDAFAALMGEHSFDAVTMAMIAARAGLGRTTIYHHFPDKESVVVAFATHETARYLDDLAGELSAAGDAVDRLRVYLRYQLEAGERFHMGLGPQLYGALSPQARLAIREHVIEVEGVLRDILSQGMADGSFAIRPDAIEETVSLVHACLGPRHLPAGTIEEFVLRALGAADR